VVPILSYRSNKSAHLFKELIERNVMGGHVERMGHIKKAYRFCSECLKGGLKRLICGARPIWDDNIKIDFKEVWQERVDWIHLTQ
jgi:hypothetical protein